MSANLTKETTSTGGISIAFDYSPYLERIASALETIAAVSTTTGIRTLGAYDWLKPTEVYSWYNQDLSPLTVSSSTVNKIVVGVNTITTSLPKFL
jgi:hypothetical protein